MEQAPNSNLSGKGRAPGFLAVGCTSIFWETWVKCGPGFVGTFYFIFFLLPVKIM